MRLVNRDVLRCCWAELADVGCCERCECTAICIFVVIVWRADERSIALLTYSTIHNHAHINEQVMLLANRFSSEYNADVARSRGGSTPWCFDFDYIHIYVNWHMSIYDWRVYCEVGSTLDI